MITISIGEYMKKSQEIVSFSTTLRRETKELLERFCKNRGVRMNHLVEQAILEHLEDEMDKEVIEARELEEVVEWKKHG
jgi:predicted transcriptional regulator